MSLAGQREQIEALIGQTIGNKYRIERLVGAGGMGAVYEALNLSINKRIALKFLFRDEGIDAAAAARFQREAETASAVASDHIVQIFDAGSTDDGRPYLVMELLDGEDLRSRLKREARLPLDAALEIAEQLLRTLGRAHQAGIIHRDLKPENIFICKRDDDALFVKIVDFGISKLVRHDETLTREGTVLGTAHYMSPEQAQAFADIYGRADLYSLGAILYEALAGRPPHLGRTYVAVLILACTTPAEDVRVHAPDVPEAIAAVIAKSIARERDQRYQTALEFWRALESAAGRTPASSEVPTKSQAPTKRDPDPAAKRAALTKSGPLPLASLDSALADTEALEGRVRAESGTTGRAPQARVTAPKTGPNWRALGIVGVLVGAIVTAGLAGRRGATPATADDGPRAVPPSSAPAALNPLPTPQNSARVPTPTNLRGSPATAKSGAPVRWTPKQNPSSAHTTVSTAVSAVASSPPPGPSPRASGVAGQLELKTQGP